MERHRAIDSVNGLAIQVGSISYPELAPILPVSLVSQEKQIEERPILYNEGEVMVKKICNQRQRQLVHTVFEGLEIERPLSRAIDNRGNVK